MFHWDAASRLRRGSVRVLYAEMSIKRVRELDGKDRFKFHPPRPLRHSSFRSRPSREDAQRAERLYRRINQQGYRALRFRLHGQDVLAVVGLLGSAGLYWLTVPEYSLRSSPARCFSSSS